MANIPVALTASTAVELRERERIAFEDGAASYEASVAEYGRPSRARTLELVELTAGVRLLDVCTGPGFLAIEAVQRQPDITVLGVDLSASMIDCARRAGAALGLGQLSFAVMDAAHLELADASFDRVTCGMGLMHTPDPSIALGEMARIARPGAVLSLSVWAQSHDTYHGFLADAVRQAAGEELRFDYGYVTRLGDPAVLSQLLEGAGWQSVTTEPFHWDMVLPSAEPIWDGMAAGGTTFGTIVADLPETARMEARQRFIASSEAWRHPDGIHLPSTLTMAAARR